MDQIQRRTWHQQLAFSVIFCQVHFWRKIVEITAKKHAKDRKSLQDTMIGLTRATNMTEYLALLDRIEGKVPCLL